MCWLKSIEVEEKKVIEEKFRSILDLQFQDLYLSKGFYVIPRLETFLES